MENWQSFYIETFDKIASWIKSVSKWEVLRLKRPEQAALGGGQRSWIQCAVQSLSPGNITCPMYLTPLKGWENPPKLFPWPHLWTRPYPYPI